jgi:hypothetical protein
MEMRPKTWNVHIQSKYMYVILFLEFIYDGSFSFVYVRNIMWDLGISVPYISYLCRLFKCPTCSKLEVQI